MGLAALLGVMASLGACTSNGTTGTVTSTPAAGTSAPPVTVATTSVTTTGAATSPTPLPTSGPISPSELAARPDSVAGATAFARYVVAQLNAAHRIPDPRLYDTIVAPTCDTCRRGRTSLEQKAAAGQRAAGDIWSVTFAGVLAWEPGRAVVELRVHQGRVAILDTLGRKVDENVERDGHFELTLTRIGDEWRISQWLNIQPTATTTARSG